MAPNGKYCAYPWTPQPKRRRDYGYQFPNYLGHKLLTEENESRSATAVFCAYSLRAHGLAFFQCYLVHGFLSLWSWAIRGGEEE